MEKEKIDWVIHGVIQNDGGIVYHTHGLNNHGMIELELNLPLEQKQAMHFVNLIAMYLVENNIVIEDEYLDKKNILQCDIYFKKAKSICEDGKELIRIILPDENFLFPWEDGCNEIYKKQLDM